MTKVMAINASPNMGKGNTALLLDPLLEGMREAGAEVELFYTKKLDIKPCQGEFSCWTRTPGHCFQQDEMQMLLPRLAEADILVLATPVYVDGMVGPMKNLLDRMIPLLEPFFELRDGHTRHPRREGVKGAKLVLVSNCGLWEPDNFDPLELHLKAACKNLGLDFAGALLRPHGPALRGMLGQGGPAEEVLASAKEAGRQLVQDGVMELRTLQNVSRELVSQGTYLETINRNFRRAPDGPERT